MTDLAKLSACPFCGGEAEVALEKPGGTGSSGMETPWPFVRCKTAKCIAMPPVVCDDWPFGKAHGYLSSKQARAKAIAAWNRRTGQLVERDGVAGVVEAAIHDHMLADVNTNKGRSQWRTVTANGIKALANSVSAALTAIKGGDDAREWTETPGGHHAA